MVCDFPSKFNFVVRSSPIICLLDAIFVVGRLAWYTAILKSPRVAMERIIRRRFQDIENEAAQNSLASLQKNTPFRLCVFTFGALPQIIKLYAMRGLPWTTVWGSMFLGSFVVTELLLLVTRRYLPPLSPHPPQISAGDSSSSSNTWSKVGPLYASLGFSFYFFTIAFFSAVEKYVGEVSWWHFFILSIFILANILSSSFSNIEFLVALSFLLSIPTTATFSMFSMVLVPLSFSFSLVGSQNKALFFVLTGGSVLFTLGLMMFNLRRLYLYISPTRVKFVDFGVGSYFLMLNVLAALLYYRFNYRPEGTLKPGWADQLG